MLSVDLNVAFAADLSGRWCPVESGENGCLNADASAAACVDADVLLE